MKHILLIATGGTIASRPTENGLAPQLWRMIFCAACRARFALPHRRGAAHEH